MPNDLKQAFDADVMANRPFYRERRGFPDSNLIRPRQRGHSYAVLGVLSGYEGSLHGARFLVKNPDPLVIPESFGRVFRTAVSFRCVSALSLGAT